MTNDSHNIDIVDSTAGARADRPRGGQRTTGLVVGAALTTAAAVGLLTVLHAHGLPASQPTRAASVPAGAPGSMLVHEQVPSWRPSTSATVSGRSTGSLTRQQVPSWSPTAPTFGQTYRDQVPAGS